MNDEKVNIFVVDDTKANLIHLTEILSASKYNVRPISDSSLVLSDAREYMPDLILLDIMMPVLTGYEVCEQLKSDEQTSDIPVIFISSKIEVLDKVKAFSIGGVDYITKPFKSEEVLARVETHLALRSLQKSLEKKNKDLSEALEQLKATQDQLILREKMAVMGQLVASIAHEINTPLGAIQSSISNVSNALNSLQNLPRVFQILSPERQADFFALIKKALENKENLSSREARKQRRLLQKEFESMNIHDPDTSADILVNMGVWGNLSPFFTLLKEKDNIFILQTAYNLSVQQRNSQNIVMAAERASYVVFALKRYAWHDYSGKMSKIWITESIDIVLTLYHNQLKHGVTVTKDYGDVPPINCFPDELNQVWTNLIHNAIQAMDGKGRLKIAVSERHGHVVVEITDSGCGIPDDIRDRVFEPFFTTKPPGEGSGLGLDIVRKIVERHRGKIEIDSQPGKTSFSVFLPSQLPLPSLTQEGACKDS
ncbi:MAG: response regulator [Desulfobacteraceae bacterium]|nr:response regulator [Desulfobacteraceae bacterium]